MTFTLSKPATTDLDSQRSSIRRESGFVLVAYFSVDLTTEHLLAPAEHKRGEPR